MPTTQTAPYAIATSALRALDSRGNGVELPNKVAEMIKPKAETANVTGRLLADLPVVDLLVEDQPIEEVIDRVFTQGAP